MKDVCWLQLVVNGYPRPNNYFQRWFDLGKDMGIAFTRPSIRSGEPPVRKIESAIGNSSAMFITDESVISAPEIAELVYKSVEQGKRILVDLNYGTRERGNALNAFLERYGIEGTLIGLLRIDEDAPAAVRKFAFLPSEPDIFKLHEEIYPTCFRDAQIFSGVKEITIRSPRLIRYTGDARPVFVIPEQTAGLIDKETDLPADWGARELACMVSNFSPETGDGVLAFAGFFLAESVFDANRTLLANLLRWISQAQHHRGRNPLRNLLT